MHHLFYILNLQSAENFATLAGKEINVTINYLGRISFDLEAIFEEWIRSELKVIVGLFGPAHARLVLCQVHTVSI